MGAGSEGAQTRLAELVAALSLGIDLGFGQPMEHVLRQCLIALRLAERMGLDDPGRSAVYYTALLVNVGCHADAHEQAKWFGDDIALKSDKFQYDFRSARGTAAMISRIGAGNPPLHRLRVGLEFVVSGYREVDNMVGQHAELARTLAEHLGLSDTVLDGLVGSYERWDGKGWPGKLGGDDIPMASRISQFAEYVEVAHRASGVEAAIALARQRSGSQFDPAVVACFCSGASELLDGLDTIGTWRAVIDAEPSLTVVLSGSEFDDALQAIAEFVDLKSPYTLGHSGAVADLAAAAGAQAGLDTDTVALLRRAGLVHNFGRLGVSNSIWDKRGPLGAGEWERVRMYPYFTERMLQQSDALAPIGRVAVQHRERLDGSGYPRGLPGSAVGRPARLLAAATAYTAMREPRPHRPALDAAAAAAELQAEVKGGQLDGDAVAAVLAAAGHRVARRREGPAGLTAREIDVLRLLVRGLSSKEISAQLVISPKTVRNHIEHIYAKIGATSRVTAGLYAVEHGLVPDVDVA